jgi:hypothetical protein
LVQAALLVALEEEAAVEVHPELRGVLLSQPQLE